MSGAVDIAVLRYVLERDPRSALFYDLAAALFEAGRWEEAERVLRAGLAFHPDHLRARVLLGASLARRGDLTGARVELEAVAKVVDDLVAGLNPELAVVLEAAGEVDQALAALRLAAQHGPLPSGPAERLRRLEVAAKQEPAPAEALLEPEVAAPEPEAAEGPAEAAPEPVEGPAEPVDEERLRAAEEQARKSQEAGEVIALLQRWLQNIREENKP